MIEDIKEIIQTICMVAGVVAIIFSLGDCAKHQSDGTDKVNIERVRKLDSLSAKCKVYYD